MAEYHGLHAAEPQPGCEAIDWRPSSARGCRVRVRAHTCMCRTPVFELCSGGGLWFVRRLSVSDSVEIAESEWVCAAVAQRLWERILSGQAS